MSGAPDWTVTLRSTFPDEYERIIETVHDHPAAHQAKLLRLFLDLASRVSSSSEVTDPINPKKRRLAELQGSVKTGGALSPITNPDSFFVGNDYSFQAPARKKQRLELVRDPSNDQRLDILLQNPQTKETEHSLTAGNIDQVFCLPVPDRPQRLWNFCILPNPTATKTDGSLVEQIVFAVKEETPGRREAGDDAASNGPTSVDSAKVAMNQLLEPFGKHVVLPDANHFSSTVVQPHRKGEKAYHVHAHRGNKEGYLFFLENGIVFGFKKPITFFPFHSIESISYTSVLQRTFNLVIAVVEDSEAGPKTVEIEFAMLDQSDFAGIDEYIKRHQLHDASMAATRRAKVYNVNKDKDNDAEVANGHASEEGAIEPSEEATAFKTEQELQDEEDELEEDYEASGGESDGEGEDTDEDDDNDNEGENYDEEGEDEELEEQEDGVEMKE